MILSSDILADNTLLSASSRALDPKREKISQFDLLSLIELTQILSSYDRVLVDSSSRNTETLEKE